jgi:alkylation response protein AidB-like acyl-CoA dehydrogenase
MDYPLQARTAAGAAFVDLAEHHAVTIAERSAEHDRDATFPVEAFDAMRASGFLGATAPIDLGGMGVASAFDLMVALNRLGRADGSVAIAAHMHLAFGLIGTRQMNQARQDGEHERADAFAALLALMAGGGIVMANATEPGTDTAHPLTTLTPVADGYRLDGRKVFSTLSPVADLFFVLARGPEEDGVETQGYAVVGRGAPGQEIRANWDALGMRASGSHEIVYDGCPVAQNMWLSVGAWGTHSEQTLVVATLGNAGLLGAFLGIAEAARGRVLADVRTRRKPPADRAVAERYGIQHQVAEMEVDLVACRAQVERIGRIIDAEMLERFADIDDLHGVNREFQAAKLAAHRHCIDIVDRAMTISGGAGYMTANPLSRYYRDVRAGPFMQPYSPNEAYEYIGKVALGLDPTITR